MRLLFGRAEPHDAGRDHAQPHRRQHRCACRNIFGVKDQPLRFIPPRTAIFGGPVRRDPAALMEYPLPGEHPGFVDKHTRRERGSLANIGRQIGGEPGAHLGVEGFVTGCFHHSAHHPARPELVERPFFLLPRLRQGQSFDTLRTDRARIEIRAGTPTPQFTCRSIPSQ
jgi:hypothetical protein